MSQSEGRPLVWRCDVCRKPIAPAKGYIYASHDQMRAHAEHERSRQSRDSGAHPVAELLAMPGKAAWVVVHADCDPDPDLNVYWIGVDDCATARQMLTWAAHLAEKTWIADTDFSGLLRRAVSGLDAEVPA